MSKLTETARGRECQIRYISVCNHDNATTVWAHYNGLAGGKGVGKKSADLLGAWACSACHDRYDRRSTGSGFERSREEIELSFWQGHARTIAQLDKEGFFK